MGNHPRSKIVKKFSIEFQCYSSLVKNTGFICKVPIGYINRFYEVRAWNLMKCANRVIIPLFISQHRQIKNNKGVICRYCAYTCCNCTVVNEKHKESINPPFHGTSTFIFMFTLFIIHIKGDILHSEHKTKINSES